MNSHIAVPKEKIDAFCQQHHVCELGLFGTVLHDDFRANSGIGVLVGFKQEHKPEVTKLGEMQDELTKIFGQNVELVERQAVEKSQNYIRRRHILKAVEPIFTA
ncbi:MAG: nucleotidyltransferase domain-containing protein [Sedimentisphaerales bacterium]|jgi:predicted nucleotidyltransferase